LWKLAAGAPMDEPYIDDFWHQVNQAIVIGQSVSSALPSISRVAPKTGAHQTGESAVNQKGRPTRGSNGRVERLG
jgi:hypothetical protein